jgi:hypothetical protein
MRAQAGLDIEQAITELGVGEALVSLLDAKGRPTPTERAFVMPPASQLGPISAEQRQSLLQASLVAGVYEKTLDRESAYEKLAAASAPGSAPGSAAPAAPTAAAGGLMGGLSDLLVGSTGPRGGQREGLAQTLVKSVVRTIGSSVGREIVRGVLGGMLGGRRR